MLNMKVKVGRFGSNNKQWQDFLSCGTFSCTKWNYPGTNGLLSWYSPKIFSRHAFFLREILIVVLSDRGIIHLPFTV